MFTSVSCRSFINHFHLSLAWPLRHTKPKFELLKHNLFQPETIFSLRYILSAMESPPSADNSGALFEIKLNLLDGGLIFSPTLSKESGNRFLELLLSIIQDICSVTDLIPKVAFPISEESGTAVDHGELYLFVRTAYCISNICQILILGENRRHQRASRYPRHS